MRRYHKLLVALLVAVTAPAALVAQERGTIVGRVTDQATGRPIVGAQVIVGQSAVGNRTGTDGRYQIQGVPVGRVDLRVSMVGYGGASRSMTVAAGQTVTADFILTPSALELGELVVTATGETRLKREIGNTVNTIAPRDINLAANNNLSQVLTGRAPSVLVQGAAGTTGTSSKIRIRGSNSLSLSNEPLLIVDGVRVSNDAANFSYGLGGQTVSRFNDINPEDIENIEVIKGPAGVALYGTAAANGVIQVTTKRGRAGRTQWTAFAETGSLRFAADVPANYAQIGVINSGANAGRRFQNCNIDFQARGTCTPLADSLYSFSPLVTHSPFRDGSRQTYGVSASGGSEGTTFYVAGDWEGEDGIVADNDLARANLRANVRANLRENIDVAVTSGYLSSRLRLPYGDNSGFGSFSAGLRGAAFPCTPQQPCIQGRNAVGTTGPLDTTSFGFSAGVPPREFQFIENRQDIERFTGGVTGNWRPFSWLQATSQAGLDVNNRFDHQLVLPGISQYSVGLFEGSRFAVRNQIRDYTANLTLTANYGLLESLQATSSVGSQYLRSAFASTSAGGSVLAPGTGSLAGASARFSANESNQEVVTVGVYAQQQLAWRDRLFLTGSIRADDNSAFGSEFDLAYYPAISASWVVSEEPFFPELGFLSNLRLRAAYGESGQRPGFRQAETFFSGVSARIGTSDVAAITVGGTGNAQLKPEQSAEHEFGLDASFFNDRVGLEVSRYDKTTQNALVSRVLAPSLGVTRTRFENLGEMNNKGWETLLRANLIDTRPVKWEGTLTYSTNQNLVVDLGENVAPILFNFDNVQRHQAGYPAGSYFVSRIVSFEDKNNDGMISRVNCPTYAGVTNPQIAGGPACEVVLTDTAEFRGTPFPGRQATLNSGVTLFDVVRLNAQLDYRGDQVLYNSSEEFRCSTSVGNCRGVQDRNAPLDEQARAVARLMGSYDGYIQKADFVKLREIGVTLMAPQRVVSRFNASALSLTLAGRNLKTWTDYLGVDPEVNSTATGNFTVADYDAVPPVRYWTARINVNF
ncbi:TonB-dependent receptor [soil metagenome]